MISCRIKLLLQNKNKRKSSLYVNDTVLYPGDDFNDSSGVNITSQRKIIQVYGEEWFSNIPGIWLKICIIRGVASVAFC